MDNVKCLKWLHPDLEELIKDNPPESWHPHKTSYMKSQSEPYRISTIQSESSTTDQSQSASSSPTDNNSPQYFSYIPNITEPDDGSNSEFSYHGNSEFSYRGNSESSCRGDEFLADFKMDSDEVDALLAATAGYSYSSTYSNLQCNKTSKNGEKDSDCKNSDCCQSDKDSYHSCHSNKDSDCCNSDSSHSDSRNKECFDSYHSDSDSRHSNKDYYHSDSCYSRDSEFLPTIDEVFLELQTQINWSVSLCGARVTTHDGSSGLSDEECFSPIQSPREVSKEESPTLDVDNTENMDGELQKAVDIWFQTDLRRDDAENLLTQQPVGTFYIRASSKKDYFALSVHISVTNPKVEHYLVHKSADGLQMDNSPLKFPNFVKLLAFFAQSKTYSATMLIQSAEYGQAYRTMGSSSKDTGIPVQLKIPRLVTSTAKASASVYDQIEAADFRQPRSTDIPTGTRSPPPRTPPNQPQLSIRPKSTHFSSHFKFPETDNSTYENVMRDTLKDAALVGVPPPKPPKPKNYRSRGYPESEESDLIYINLDKGPEKPEPMLTCRYQNDLNFDSEKKRSVKFRDVEVQNNKNIKLNRKGPAIFHAPPPPPYEEDEEHGKMASFIPPSPPATPPSMGSEDESEMGSSMSSIYTSKTSIDQAGGEVRGMRQRHQRPPSVMDKVRSRVFKDRSQRQSVRAKLCHKLQSQILRLTDSHDCTFGARVTTFVTFVKQQHEKKADRLLLQIREFMCTIKHEMISARSSTLEDMVSRAQRKGPPPKLNDIIEGVLVKAVIWPLRAHIHSVLYEGETEENVMLKKSMNLALTKSYEELGIDKDIFCGEEVDWTEPVQCLQDICSHYSPVKKLERLLACVNCVYMIIKDINIEMRGTPRSIGADEFLPLFIYVVALSGMDKADEDIRYMQGLLDPPLLIGEPGYYLTTLASSVMLLKSLEFDKPHVLPSVGHLQSMLQIHFTDPDMKQIAYKTLPVHQSTTCRDLLDILSSKFRLENVSDYGLYKVEENVETLLDEAECPQLIKGQWLVASLERDINSYFTFHLKS